MGSTPPLGWQARLSFGRLNLSIALSKTAQTRQEKRAMRCRRCRSERWVAGMMMPAYSTAATIVMMAALVIPVALGSEPGNARTIAAAQLSAGSGITRPIQSGTSGIGRGAKVEPIEARAVDQSTRRLAHTRRGKTAHATGKAWSREIVRPTELFCSVFRPRNG